MTATLTEARLCVECGRPMRASSEPPDPARAVHAGRGRCRPCRDRAKRSGVLAEHPTKRDAFLEEWAVLRVGGATREVAAERMGMTFAAFERALFRARAAGDLRAKLGVRR